MKTTDEFISASAVTNKLKLPSDVIGFGKYKGATVSYVLRKDPCYLEWLIEETETTEFSRQFQDKVFESASEERSHSLYGWYNIWNE